MSVGEIDIERIVREVLRRLQTPAAAGAVAIDDRVVTTATLDEKLNGAARVVLRTKAIITPAAKDELRQRGVQVEYRQREDASVADGKASLLAAQSLAKFNAAPLWRLVGPVEMVANGEVKHAVASLCETVTSQRKLGVLATDQPAAALCLANRRSDIRAVLGTDETSLREAIDATGANVLVVDPRRRGLFEIRRVIEAFHSDQWRKPPPEFGE